MATTKTKTVTGNTTCTVTTTRTGANITFGKVYRSYWAVNGTQVQEAKADATTQYVAKGSVITLYDIPYVDYNDYTNEGGCGTESD